MMRDLTRSIGNAVLEGIGRAVGQAQERTPLAVDLLEGEDAYLAVFDAPGATAHDVQVRYHDGRIEVRIDRFREFHEGYEMRYPGRGLALDGSVTLPDDDVEAERARAVVREDGTLAVRVPKRDPGTPSGGGSAVEIAIDEGGDEDDTK